MPKRTLYTAEATARGGRHGRIRSSDGVLDLAVSPPRALGGQPGATNPEQLFAAGYASCFQQAIMVAAGREKIAVDPDFTVGCLVALQQADDDTYGLAATLEVNLKSVPRAQALTLVQRAHAVCPYSLGVRGNMTVQLVLVEDNGHRTEVAEGGDHK